MMARRFTRNAKSQPRKARTRCGKSAPEHGQLAVKSTANMGIADMTNPTQEAVEAVRFDDCPEGLFWFGQHLGFMTEYATAAKDGFRQRDAYVVESGEYFWGGTSDPRKRAELLVFPVEDPVAALRPAGDSGEVAVKALEWNDNNIGVSYADTPFGRYRATNSGWWFGADHLTYAPSKEAAKSAAQAEYDRRIRSALAAPVHSTDAGVERKRHAEQILRVAAFLAATRMQGWANPLVCDLTDAAYFLDPSRRETSTGEAALSSPQPPATQIEQDRRLAAWRKDRLDSISLQPPEQETVRVTDEVVDYVLRYGGQCRDCADVNGVCPYTGLPCDVAEAKTAIRHVLKAVNYGITNGFLSTALASARPEGWRGIETAPRDGTRILATGGGLGGKVEIVAYLPRTGAWETRDYVLDDLDDEPQGYSRPLLWSPIPAAPAPADEVKP